MNHGTRYAYQKVGCRCDQCRDWQSAYSRDRYAARHGEPDAYRLPEIDAGPRPWTANAACATSPLAFVVGRGENVDRQLAICETCPVKAPCLAFAIEFDEHGVWGGTQKRERDRIRRKQAA